MGDTNISWTHRPGTRGRSWNPVQGCQMISPGCKHCYAMKMAARFAQGGWSQGLINPKTGKWTGELRMAEHKLLEPLSWRDPSTVFVNSMSDLFAFSNEQICAVFGTMAVTPQHTYIIATKRSREMRAWFSWLVQQPMLEHPYVLATKQSRICVDHTIQFLPEYDLERFVRGSGEAAVSRTWPLPNVWLLVSVENEDYVWRIEDLLAVPAAIRGVSLEPLLGPIDLRRVGTWQGEPLSALAQIVGFVERPPLDWVITGCESGVQERPGKPGRRPAHSDWFRSLRDQCEGERTPFFFKQGCDRDPGGGITGHPGDRRAGGIYEPPQLDGVSYNQFPEVVARD